MNSPERNRKLLRLKNFDYSSDGAYFITTCTKNREDYFGEINDGRMILNELGKIAEKCWREIPIHFPDTKLDEFIVMPNHIHGIIWIENEIKNHNRRINSPSVGNENFHSLPNHLPIRGAKSRSLSSIVRGFKIGVTKMAHQNNFSDFIWQKSFHDRIVRNEDELNNIREYIWQNPKNWENDKNNLK